ncbi:MAG: universal stress protein [Alphaproteobacteria bacterium]
MSYKSILLHVDTDKNMNERAAAAIGIAERCGAHLTAIHVSPPLYIPAYVAAQVGDVVVDVNEKVKQEAEAAAKAQYDKIAARTTLPIEWRIDSGHVATVMSVHARYADLTVLGQYNAENEAAAFYPDLVENVVMDAGRPILVIPYAGKFPTVGKNVLLAWNASREATRAVSDAMPLLQTADKVTVFAVNPEGGPDGHGEMPGADIALYLARHGVKAEVNSLNAKDLEVGDVLLSRAADLGIDLLVMGAYGRSRLREFILGGASRDILRHMTIPVLMSH